MTTTTEKAASLIDRIIADVGLELPDRITCGWQEALDGLVREARAEERLRLCGPDLICACGGLWLASEGPKHKPGCVDVRFSVYGGRGEKP